MLSESQLSELCHALGWQGGTFHQVLETVQALAQFQGAKIVAYQGTVPGYTKDMLFPAISTEAYSVDDPAPLYRLSNTVKPYCRRRQYGCGS